MRNLVKSFLVVLLVTSVAGVSVAIYYYQENHRLGIENIILSNDVARLEQEAGVLDQDITRLEQEVGVLNQGITHLEQEAVGLGQQLEKITFDWRRLGDSYSICAGDRRDQALRLEDSAFALQRILLRVQEAEARLERGEGLEDFISIIKVLLPIL